jgi:reverse gyrase
MYLTVTPERPWPLLIHSEADLVVMATHGRGAFEKFLLGSTTDEIVGRSNKPILLVRGTDNPADLKYPAPAHPGAGRFGWNS